MKIDLHVHTQEVSRCGKITAKEAVNLYKEAGYDAICITNHFSEYTKNYHRSLGRLDWIKVFNEGYQLAKEEGERVGLRVFKGYEFRCNKNDNDFLLYDLPTSIVENIDVMFNLPIKDCLKVLRENGVKIYQAHPFRNNTTVIDPALLDGVEIYNASNGRGYINDMAKVWAKEYPHLHGISGSDCHTSNNIGYGGIITSRDVKNERELIDCIQSGDYTIIERYKD